MQKSILDKLIVSLALMWLLLCSWQLNSLSHSVHDLNSKINMTNITDNAIHLAFSNYSFHNNVSAANYWLKIAKRGSTNVNCTAAIDKVIGQIDGNLLPIDKSSDLGNMIMELDAITFHKDNYTFARFLDLNHSNKVKSQVKSLIDNIGSDNKYIVLDKVKQAIDGATTDTVLLLHLRRIKEALVQQTLVSFDPLKVCTTI